MTIDIPHPNFEPDFECEEWDTEQWYWNYNDGGFFLLLEIRSDEVTVAEMDGSVEIYQREGMIFNPEEVGSTIRPVKFVGYDG